MASLQLAPGATIAGYRIEDELGRGGMGMVYRATQLALGRTVALKLIALEVSADERFRERFAREARIAASLEHPHVLPIYEAGDADGTLFLSMRYVADGDLAAALRPGPLAPEDAVAIVAQVAEALDAAHERGLVHRDVKPSNILLEQRQGKAHAYLTDFGLAKFSASQRGLTKTGAFVGTLDYVAPEQIRGQQVDARSDVYALGCLLYEALTGQVPYPHEDELAKLWAHMHEAPPVPSEFVPRLSRGLDRVVARAMAKDPDERYAGARALADACLSPPAEDAAPPAEATDVAPRTNLPLAPTPLVGRRRELTELRELLARGDVRLLTLTGPGGVGKTRLALELAAEVAGDFRDGVYLVGLAPIRDAELVLATIAQTLVVPERGGDNLAETLAQHVAERELLLVLDNFEQVVAAAPALAELLSAAPSVTVLVTSREPLHLSAEQCYPVPPLALPDSVRLDPDVLAENDAVALFAARAMSARRDFRVTAENAAAVVEICTRVDGLPLALELAAARLRVLSPQMLLARLEQRLPVLTGGARDLDERQRTLRAAISWSYELLTQRDQTLFARLAVFAGGARLDAAEAVCDAEGDLGIDLLDGLQSLVEKNLLQQTDDLDGEPRFGMLETIREYALERLGESEEVETVLRRFAEYHLGLAERAHGAFRGPEQAQWIRRLQREYPNFRAAVRWSLTEGERETAARLSIALIPFWEIRGPVSESRAWVRQLLLTNGMPNDERALLLFAEGRLALVQGDFDAAARALDESTGISRDTGDAATLIEALGYRGFVAREQGALDEAVAFCEEAVALARGSADKRALAEALSWLAATVLNRNDVAGARRLYEESLALFRELGDTGWTARQLVNLGWVAILEEHPAEARAPLEEGLALARQLESKLDVAVTLGNLGLVALYERDDAQASTLFEQALALYQELGMKLFAAEAFQGLAAVAVLRGDPLRAAQLAGAADGLHEALAAPPSAAERLIADRHLSAARESVDEDAFADASARGRQMAFDKAVEYALASDVGAAAA